MTGFQKLSIEQLEAFIEKNKKYEKQMPVMLEDARCELLHKKIAEFIANGNGTNKELTNGK